MKIVFCYFIVSRLFFLLSAFIASYIIPLQNGYLGNEKVIDAPYLVWIWANFDGRHFLDIASIGYHNFDFAFFPLYPVLIHILKWFIPIPAIYLGILLSSISLIISGMIIYKIVKIDFNEKIARLSSLFLFFIPVGFFHHSVYADSLFLLTSTASFYFARQDRWFFSGILGFLTVLTRLSGLSLIPALIIEWYLRYKKRLIRYIPISINILFLLALGLLIYMLYLSVNTGDPFIFQKSFAAWNQGKFTFPPQVIFRYIKIFFSVDPHLLVYWVAILEFLSLFFYFGLAVFVLRKVRISYGIFMIVLLTLVTFTGTFAGTPRYILHLFPAYLALALIVNKKRKIFKRGILLLFLILGFILTALFTRGYFIS